MIRPEIDVAGTRTLVMIDQTAAIDPERLGKHTGRLDPGELAAVDDALRLVFGLPH
jgi:mRNA interferase MazF